MEKVMSPHPCGKHRTGWFFFEEGMLGCIS